MKNRYNNSAGNTMLVEIDEPGQGRLVKASFGDKVTNSQQTLEKSLKKANLRRSL